MEPITLAEIIYELGRFVMLTIIGCTISVGTVEILFAIAEKMEEKRLDRQSKLNNPK